MNIIEAKEIIKRYVSSDAGKKGSVLYIQGAPGIGKSDIVKQVGEEIEAKLNAPAKRTFEANKKELQAKYNKLEDKRTKDALSLKKELDSMTFTPEPFPVKVSYMATMLTEQITGLPVIGDSKDIGWSVPEVIDFEGMDRGILFLDDIHLAEDDIQKYLFQLLIYRSIHGHKLPENVSIILAGNRDEDHAGANLFMAPVINRIMAVEVSENFKVWFDWASRNDVHPSVLSFLTSENSALMGEPLMGEAWSSPRAWANLSEKIESMVDMEVLKNGTDKQKYNEKKVLMELTRGHLSKKHADAFIEHVLYYSKFNAEDILSKNFKINNLEGVFEASAALFVAGDYLFKYQGTDKEKAGVKKAYIKLLEDFTKNTNFRPLTVFALKNVVLKDTSMYDLIMKNKNIKDIVLDMTI